MVNPMYDLDDIFKNRRKDLDERYKKPTMGYKLMEQGDLISIFSGTFNSSVAARTVYSRMINKYDEFFDKEKEKIHMRMASLIKGK